MLRYPPAPDAAVPDPFRLGRQPPAATDYTAPGAQPGYIILRPFQVTADTMLVCVLFFADVSYSRGASEELERTLRDAGMRAQSQRVPLRVHGLPVDPIDPEATVRHTLVDGSREALLRLVRQDPARAFDAAFLFTRLGKEWSDPEEDPELLAAIVQLEDSCDVIR